VWAPTLGQRTSKPPLQLWATASLECRCLDDFSILNIPFPDFDILYLNSTPRWKEDFPDILQWRISARDSLEENFAYLASKYRSRCCVKKSHTYPDSDFVPVRYILVTNYIYYLAVRTQVLRGLCNSEYRELRGGQLTMEFILMAGNSFIVG